MSDDTKEFVLFLVYFFTLCGAMIFIVVGPADLKADAFVLSLILSVPFGLQGGVILMRRRK